MKVLPNELIVALNAQIQREQAACHAYWQMEWAFLDLGWKGLACWAHEAATDERHHAKSIAYYMVKKRNARPLSQTIQAPTPFYDMTPLEMFQAAAALEADVTDAILKLYAFGEDFDDEGLCYFLAEFIEEQAESEGELLQIIKLFKAADDEGAALILLDKKLKGMA